MYHESAEPKMQVSRIRKRRRFSSQFIARSTALLVAVIVMPHITFGQAGNHTSIILASVELRLGMPQEEVLSELSRYATVRPAEGVWFVFEKNGSPADVLGNITFQDGRLSAVVKEWGPQDQLGGVEFARSLYGAISEFEKEGRTFCTIAAGETQNPKAEIKTANISCGRKYISITMVHTSDSNESASIEEILH